MFFVQSLSHVRLFATPWLQHARLLCPLLCPRVCSIHVHWVSDAIQPSHPLSPLSPFAFSFFPASVSFSVSRLFTIRWPKYWSFSFRSVLQMNIQGWFPLGLTVWSPLLSKGLSRVFSGTTVQKHQFCGTQPVIQLSHLYTTTGKS